MLQVVNGPDHPGAVGAPPAKTAPPPPQIPAHSGSTGAPAPGWRQVLLDQGPEGWAKAVRDHKGMLITDTTW